MLARIAKSLIWFSNGPKLIVYLYATFHATNRLCNLNQYT